MQRREFIQNMLAVGIPVFFSKSILASENFKAIDEEQNLTAWKNILEYARWSPSVHNIQPWQVKIENDGNAKVYCDTTKFLTIADPKAAFSYITMSVFVECIRIAADNENYACSINYHQPVKEKDLQLFADIKLNKASTTPLFNKELLKQRKTSRIAYSGKCMTNETKEQLQKVCTDFEIQFGHSAEEKKVENILLLNRDTLFNDADNEKYRGEIERWIRTTDEEAHKTKDGLWNYCMGFPGKLMHNFFYKHQRYTSDWKRKIIGRNYLHSMKGTKDIIWFSGSFENFTDWINCGKFLLQFWLTLTKNKLVMHPFGSLITNQNAYAQLPALLSHNNTLWFVARVGQSDDAPRSLRKDLETILIN